MQTFQRQIPSRSGATGDGHADQRLAALGALSSGVAHELHNPLGAILMAAEFALISKEDPNARRTIERSLLDIIRNANRCSRLVGRMLEFGRTDALSQRQGDLNEVIETAYELLRPYVEEQKVMLALALSESLPAVEIHAGEVGLALVQVIRNAVESAAPRTRILVQTEGTPTTVRVIVSDEGPEEAADLSDAASVSSSSPGLDLAAQILEQHGGRLERECLPGEGQTVTLEFPLQV